eukprot:SAG11_NODE_16887_length_534_cov_1.101149_1_plen_64_part_00
MAVHGTHRCGYTHLFNLFPISNRLTDQIPTGTVRRYNSAGASTRYRFQSQILYYWYTAVVRVL